MLADICNENGDHENALSHVLKAIDLQETINEQQRYRLLAESYYKLGLIYELINKFFLKLLIVLIKLLMQFIKLLNNLMVKIKKMNVKNSNHFYHLLNSNVMMHKHQLLINI